MVVPHRMYFDGGTAGSGEFFGAHDVIAATIGASNAETCTTYNMLKLSRLLFFHTAGSKYMQFYERALIGTYLADRSPNNSNTNPNVVYFLNVSPGTRRSFDNLGTCDGGTAPEELAKFQDSIYFSSVDDSTLYVNLYIASTLTWAAKGIAVEQSTNYPADPTGETSLTVTGNATFTLKLRVPYWVRKGFTVRVNGADQNLDATPGTYVSINRSWHTGDTVEISMPFTVRAEGALDQPQTQGLAFGPVPLVTLNNSTSYLTYASLYPSVKNLAGDLKDALTPTADLMQFAFNGNTIRPFYIEDTARYHAYIHRSEPEIIFAGVDSGVPNYPENPTVSTLWVAGKFGNAILLDGSGPYVSLPNAIVNGLSDFTVAAWVNPATVTSWVRLFDFVTGTGQYMFLTISSGSSLPRFAITTSGSGGEQQLTSSQAISASTWTHVAVTLSGATGTLYLNGNVVASNSTMTLKPSSLGSTGNNWIGKSQYGDPLLTGSVDEFQIYNRALSQAEVQSLLTSAGGSPGGGNVAWYRFEETTGTTAHDSSGNAKAGAVTNFAPVIGTTFLDLVWDQAPFKDVGDFRSAVAILATQWLAAGKLTAAEKDAIVSAAARAKIS
jgi:hypothetical protein